MKQLILLLIIIPFSLHSMEPFVEIYKTHDSGMYGRSETRDIVLSVKDSVFKRYKTLPVNSEYNYKTAVTIDSQVVNRLDEMFESVDTIHKGYIKITKEGDIYTLEDDNLFLSFSFSFEKPGSQILEVIKSYYSNNIIVRDLVLSHYMENSIINIHSAENLLLPEAMEITYDEVIIMATIIGDKNQWLWGVHDGKDYLRKLLLQ